MFGCKCLGLLLCAWKMVNDMLIYDSGPYHSQLLPYLWAQSYSLLCCSQMKSGQAMTLLSLVSLWLCTRPFMEHECEAVSASTIFTDDETPGSFPVSLLQFCLLHLLNTGFPTSTNNLKHTFFTYPWEWIDGGSEYIHLSPWEADIKTRWDMQESCWRRGQEKRRKCSVDDLDLTSLKGEREGRRIQSRRVLECSTVSMV